MNNIQFLIEKIISQCREPSLFAVSTHRFGSRHIPDVTSTMIRITIYLHDSFKKKSDMDNMNESYVYTARIARASQRAQDADESQRKERRERHCCGRGCVVGEGMKVEGTLARGTSSRI